MPNPRIEIEYCNKCRFVLRATWLAQELLFTFGDVLGEIALIPGQGGVFVVRLNGIELHSRAATGCFPDIKDLKQQVRDQIAPERHLGHSDRKSDLEQS